MQRTWLALATIAIQVLVTPAQGAEDRRVDAVHHQHADQPMYVSGAASGQVTAVGRARIVQALNGPGATATPVDLNPGSPQRLTFPAVTTSTFFEDIVYRIDVSQGTGRMQVDLDMEDVNTDVDMFLRYGSAPTFQGTQPVCDAFSNSVYGVESLALSTASGTPLKAGTYYLAFRIVTTNTAGAGTVSVTFGADTFRGSNLRSGRATGFSLPAVSSPTLFTGDHAYAIQVPPGATELKITTSTVSNVDVDLYSSFGASPTVSAGKVVSDYKSNDYGGSESLSITAASSPALRAGIYYVCLALYDTGMRATGIINATVNGVFVPVTEVSTVSSASLRTGVVARDSLVMTTGSGLATRTAQGDSREPLNQLAGTTIKLTDSRGSEGYADMSYASPTQLNWLMPEWPADGPVRIEITNADQYRSTSQVDVASIAPGILTANGDGKGAPLGAALTIRADGGQDSQPLARLEASRKSYVPANIDLAATTDAMYLVLYGTGLRNGSPGGFAATLGGKAVAVGSGGPVAGSPGLDQVNVGPLDPSMANQGQVDLVLTVDGVAANTVAILLSDRPMIPGPTLTNIQPNSARRGTTTTGFVLNGSDLGTVTAVEFEPAGGIAVSNLKTAPTAVTADIRVDAAATPGERNVRVLAPGGASNSLKFTIPAVAPGTPEISGLTAGYTGVSITRYFYNPNYTVTYYGYAFKFNFTDSDSDIAYTANAARGNARLTIKLTSGGSTCTVFDNGADSLNKSGQTSGQINHSLFLNGGSGSGTFSVTLTDGAGNTSNALTAPASFACPVATL
jgi:uncharacterized protein (TIGR03437 family)